MLAEVRRHIAHPQPSVRAPAVRVRPPIPAVRLAEAALVLGVGRIDLLGAAIRVVVQREQQVATDTPLAWPQGQRLLETCDRFVQPPLLLVGDGQVVEHFKRIGLARQRAQQHGLGLGIAVVVLQAVAQVALGFDVVGQQRRRTQLDGQRLLRAPLRLQHHAQSLPDEAVVRHLLAERPRQLLAFDEALGTEQLEQLLPLCLELCRVQRAALGETREHRTVGLLHAARKAGFVHQRAGLQLATQGRAHGGQRRQVAGQRNDLVHVLVLGLRDPFGPPQALQQGAAQAAHAGPVRQRHERNALVQLLDQRGA